jgi:flagellar biosynthesis anti-sigma factor FlgM
MRIDLSNSVASQLSSELSSQQVSTQAAAQSSAKSQGISEDDRTTLSSPEVRQGRVDNLRQAISNGEYQVDPSSVAAAMVGESS